MPQLEHGAVWNDAYYIRNTLGIYTYVVARDGGHVSRCSCCSRCWSWKGLVPGVAALAGAQETPHWPRTPSK